MAVFRGVQTDHPSRLMRDLLDNMVPCQFALLKNFHQEIFVEGEIQFDFDSEAGNAGGRVRGCKLGCHDEIETVVNDAVAALL